MTLQAKSYDLRLRVLEMIHIGEKPVFSEKGLVTSLAWGMEGKVDYVLEGNINYTGAVTKWVVEELGLLTSSKEAGPVAQSADPADTHLSGPRLHRSGGALLGQRRQGHALRHEPHHRPGGNRQGCGGVHRLSDCRRAGIDGPGGRRGHPGAAGGRRPHQEQIPDAVPSDILNLPVAAPEREELSGMGAAFCAGIAAGVYSKEIIQAVRRSRFLPVMEAALRRKKREGWKQAVETLLTRPGTK